MRKTIREIENCRSILSLIIRAGKEAANSFSAVKDYRAEILFQKQEEIQNVYMATVQNISQKMLAAAKELQSTFEDELEPKVDTASTLGMVMQYLATADGAFTPGRLQHLIRPLQAAGDLNGLILIKELAETKNSVEATLVDFGNVALADVLVKRIRQQMQLLQTNTIANIKTCDCSGIIKAVKGQEDPDLNILLQVGPGFVVQGTGAFLANIEENVNSLAGMIERTKAGEPEPESTLNWMPE